MKVIVSSAEEFKSILEEELKKILPEIINQISQHSSKKSEWLTVKQKADQQNISVSMVYKLLAQGKLETKTIGRKRLIKA